MLTAANFTVTLNAVSDVGEHVAYIDRLVRSNEHGRITQLYAQSLEIAAHGQKPQWQHNAILEACVRRLALHPGLLHAKTAFELTDRAESQLGKSATPVCSTGTASIVAASQPAEIVEDLLRSALCLEAAGALLQEAILKRIPASAAVRENIQRRLAAANHPLATLPLELLEVETELCLPSYSASSTVLGMPFGPYLASAQSVPAQKSSHSKFHNVTTSERASLIELPFKQWREDSNGQTEVGVFHIQTAHPQLPADLASIELDALQSRGRIHIPERSTLTDVFSVLFSAAAQGGAYGGGQGNALGRLRAWQSLSGFVNGGLDSTIHSLVQQAQKCEWQLFSADNDWFYEVAWDVGIACLNCEKKELVILAATDTD